MVDPAHEQPELVGLVAYALYKRSKREWAEAIGAKHRRKPTDHELEQYVDSWTDSRLSGLKEEAKSALASFAYSIVEEETPKIEKEALKGKFWGSVFESVCGAFLYTILLVIVAVLLSKAGVDALGVLKEAAKPGS
ncbi:hypothetical protein [Hansschlegelia beijingensis]|uniref:hypothetical protein n=1 Tax=Hansschlegelia beijingensis TaxID=1133344 RepID=UPI003890FF67